MRLINVPPRNPHFVGRTEILVRLHETVNSEIDNPRIAVLTGLAGIEKSQIEIHFAYYLEEVKGSGKSVIWVDCSSSTSFWESLRWVARAFHTPGSDNRNLEERERSTEALCW